jgi:hypothetical protein
MTMIPNITIAFTLIAVFAIPNLISPQSLQGFINSDPDPRKAPAVISENNIYVVWTSNNTGNNEVMFRVSNVSGKTFSDKINLSNSPSSDSTRVEIAADAGRIIVTWWERSDTEETPVARVSDDFGKTFGPLIKLGINGQIGTGEVKPL